MKYQVLKRENVKELDLKECSRKKNTKSSKPKFRSRAIKSLRKNNQYSSSNRKKPKESH